MLILLIAKRVCYKIESNVVFLGVLLEFKSEADYGSAAVLEAPKSLHEFDYRISLDPHFYYLSKNAIVLFG